MPEVDVQPRKGQSWESCDKRDLQVRGSHRVYEVLRVQAGRARLRLVDPRAGEQVFTEVSASRLRPPFYRLVRSVAVVPLARAEWEACTAATAAVIHRLQRAGEHSADPDLAMALAHAVEAGKHVAQVEHS